MIRDLRRDIAGVPPKPFRGAALGQKLKVLAQTMKGRHFPGFHLRLDQNALSRVSSQEALHILFIAQEAMSNTLRHSGAQVASVSLQEGKNMLRFEVTDDGVGFDTQAGRVVGVAPGVTSIVFSYKTSSNSTAYVSPPIPVVVTPSSVALNE